MINFCDIDEFLETDHYLSMIKAKGYEIKNIPSNLDELFRHYRECIENAKRNDVTYIRGETFSQEFVLDQNNNYCISWCIETAKDLIKEYKLKTETLKIKKLIGQINKKDINQSYLPTALKNDEPIIIAYYNSSPDPYVVIDGNHRVAAKMQLQNDIEAYVLSPNIHRQAMVSELDQLLFAIHYNLSWIGDFIVGLISFDEMTQKIAPI